MPHGAWNGNCLMAAATKAIASHIPTLDRLWLAIKGNATTACHYGSPIQLPDALGLSSFAPSLPSIIIYRMSRGGYEWTALCLFLPLMDSYRLVMKEKLILMTVNRLQVCRCVSGGCAARIRGRIEWDPTPKRLSIQSPFSGSSSSSS